MIGVLFLCVHFLACSFLAPTSGMGAKKLTLSLQHFTCSLCGWYVHAHARTIAAMRSQICGLSIASVSKTGTNRIPNSLFSEFLNLTFLILRFSNSPFLLNGTQWLQLIWWLIRTCLLLLYHCTSVESISAYFVSVFMTYTFCRYNICCSHMR